MYSAPFHSEKNHKPVEKPVGEFQQTDTYISHICTGSLWCRCEHFEEQHLVQFAAEIAEIKQKKWNQFDKAKYILEKIPQTRNAGEKTFAKIYNEIWFGFKIRAKGTSLTTDEFNKLPSADSVNREKRRAKQLDPTLATYDGKVLKHQAAIYQALMEMAAGT